MPGLEWREYRSSEGQNQLQWKLYYNDKPYGGRISTHPHPCTTPEFVGKKCAEIPLPEKEEIPQENGEVKRWIPFIRWRLKGTKGSDAIVVNKPPCLDVNGDPLPNCIQEPIPTKGGRIKTRRIRKRKRKGKTSKNRKTKKRYYRR